MKFFTKTVAIVLAMFLFTSFSNHPLADILRFNLPVELRRVMDENRKITFPPLHPDLEYVINSFVPRNLDKDEHYRVLEILGQARRRHMAGQGYFAFIRNWGTTVDFGAFLTHEQLDKEIRFFFDLLRHGYDGYLYFGGDDVFLPVRDAMLERLADMTDPLQVYSYLNDLLVPAFQGVIADNHFHVQHVRFGPPAHVPFMNEEFILRRSEGGFVTVIDGISYRVVEVTRHSSSPLDGTLPTLTPAGELVWVFGIVTTDSGRDVIEITVLLENTATNESRSHPVDLHRIDSPQFLAGPMVSICESAGITIMKNRRLSAASPSLTPFEETDAFLRSGYELRDSPILIMDLRGHTGGSSSLARQWMEMYVDHKPQRNSLFAWSSLRISTVASALTNFFSPSFTALHLLTPENLMGERFIRAKDPRFAETRVTGTSALERPPLTTSVSGTLPHVPIPNKNLVIVLTDKNIGSAGELFVGHLRQLENVLVVGTNTAGALLTSNVGRAILPYSGLAVMFGTRLNLRHDLSQFEGIGFKPDLWVPPGESLERVLRFIERYGLVNAASGTTD